MQFLLYWLIYNLRISFFGDLTYLALADIKVCFRVLRIHSDLAVAFGFMTISLFYLVSTVVVGSSTHASSWEPFCRATSGLTEETWIVQTYFVEKHKHYINMVKWEIPSPNMQALFEAATCKLNPYVFDSFGNHIHQPSKIWINNTRNAAVGRFTAKMVFVAVIKAIFVAMCKPNTCLWQCPLLLDK